MERQTSGPNCLERVDGWMYGCSRKITQCQRDRDATRRHCFFLSGARVLRRAALAGFGHAERFTYVRHKITNKHRSLNITWVEPLVGRRHRGTFVSGRQQQRSREPGWLRLSKTQAAASGALSTTRKAGPDCPTSKQARTRPPRAFPTPTAAPHDGIVCVYVALEGGRENNILYIYSCQPKVSHPPTPYSPAVSGPEPI